MVAEVTAGLLGGLLALGGWERVQRDRAHAAIPTRIHVNGTRGKSTVTRLIAAALRASGCPDHRQDHRHGGAAHPGWTDAEVPIRRRTVPASANSSGFCARPGARARTPSSSSAWRLTPTFRR